MIRTNSVTLSSLPAIAYRQKFPSGGSGIVIVRSDASQPGVAGISKTSGDPIITANTPSDLYPAEAFKEAIALTAGMPYRKQGKPAAPKNEAAVNEAVDAVAAEVAQIEAEAEEVIIDGDDYQKIVDAYTDKNGKLSYDLINKDLIKFVHSSSICAKMIAEGAAVEDIRLYAVATKFRNITGNADLTDGQVLRMAELLDEVSPKGVFKALNSEIRARLGAVKKK